MITFLADFSVDASVGASISCTSPAGAAGFFADGGGVAPKPPKMTFQIERFIARHMMYERIAPLEPTSAPVTISRSLCSMKPAAAAVQPEQLFRLDTTPGRAAPTESGTAEGRAG